MNASNLLSPSIRFWQRGWHNANHILLLGGEGSVLVDTGGDEDGAVLVAMMKNEGVTAAALSLIVNTHSHWDHSGESIGGRMVRPARTPPHLARLFCRTV